MNIELPITKRILSILLMTAVFLTIDFFWGSVLCDNFSHIFIYAVAIVAQLFTVVEVGSNISKDYIRIDTRSEERKALDERDRAIGLIEGAKNNFLLQIAEGRMDAKTAHNRIKEMDDFLILDENHVKQLKSGGSNFQDEDTDDFLTILNSYNHEA